MDDTEDIFVKHSGHINCIGSGFESRDAVEKVIEERYGPGNYEYGTFSEIGTHQVPKPEYHGEDIDEHAEALLQELAETCGDDRRVKSFSRIESPNRLMRGVYHGLTVQYSVSEVDFVIRLDSELFESVPVSAFDMDVRQQLKAVLDDLLDNVVYLGCDSGYASRGRRNPFVSLYGRVERDTVQDREVRSLYDHSAVETVLWTTKNISAIPIRVSDTYEYGEEDLLIVLTRKSDDDDFDQMIEEEYNWVGEQDVTTEAETLTTEWVGKIGYGDDHERRLCLGVTKRDE